MSSGFDDDLLRLVFIACHAGISQPARVALTLRLLGGLTTAEIAHALPEPTIGQTHFRAKNDLARVSAALEGSDPTERTERLDAVLEVIYLIFNEGYAATSGIDWTRPELCDEALRLGRLPVGPRSYSTRADRDLGCRSTRRGRWAPTCFKPKSRRVTHEPAPRPERTGDRSRSGTTCWPRSPRHRSCSSTGPYQVGRSHGPPAGLALLDTIGDDPKVVATTSTAPFGPTCSTSLAAPKKPGPSSKAPRHSPPTKPNKTCSSNAPPGSPTRSENLSSTCRTRLAPSDVSLGRQIAGLVTGGEPS